MMVHAHDLSEVEGPARVVIAAVHPSVDGGRFAVKRIVGELLTVEVDLLVDGHDLVAARLQVRAPGGAAWSEVVLAPAGPHAVDRWGAVVPLDHLGTWALRVEAWVDRFGGWARGLKKKVAAGNEVQVELDEGALLLDEAARGAADAGDAAAHEGLTVAAARARDRALPAAQRAVEATAPVVSAWVSRYAARRHATRSARPYEVIVERPRARFSAWYEFFPRSTGASGVHGTLADAQARLDYVAELGFDVVYLPPIHPIGVSHRKGPNNTLVAGPGDPGSPWAIGGAAGGHTALHPDLGTLDDFAAFVGHARERGIDVAIDIAFQASPDHPWVREHPDWFIQRPDGTIQHAENPPKKYQDVYPFDFECADWRGLWRGLADVFLTWCARGVRTFRVDNPHTKPIPFWAWCLAEVRAQYPDAIFLSEAFTRPLLLEMLAKIGFSQSYTYFTWRTTQRELTDYLTHLTTAPRSEFLVPNLWPNTPDILPEHLQLGGRPAFAQRVVLAATLSSSYGIYGPSYELCDGRPVPGHEEYADSEKYQLRDWDLDAPHSLRHLLTRLNRIRREHPALQTNATLRFHPCEEEGLLAYSKTSGDDAIICVVDLDPYHRRGGWITLDLAALGLAPDQAFQVHDLLGDARYRWQGARCYVELDPHQMPAHVFAVKRTVRREQGFDYYL